MTFISATISPPKVPYPMLARPTLEARIDKIMQSRVTTVFAPAGYGKTRAALRWAELASEKGRPLLWLAARAGITSSEGFVESLCAAGAAVGMDGLGSTPSPTDFARCCGKMPTSPLLVLDDAQNLPRTVFDYLEQAVAAARDTLTTIIVSRRKDTIPIARLRSLGYLVEIGQEDLRFSDDEIRQLVGSMSDSPYTEDDIRLLTEDTRGWPAGVTMARLAQGRRRRKETDLVIRPVHLHREYESYFREEVLSQESEEVVNFVVATSVLDEVTVPGGAAVTGGGDSSRLLHYAESAGIFLSELDTDCSRFEYHPLFKAMMLRRLHDDASFKMDDVQRAASRFYAESGDMLRAVSHAQASGDSAFLADMLEELAEPLIYTGKLYLVNEVASTLPSSAFVTRPRLALAVAWRRIRSLAFEAAEALIAMAEAEIERRAELDGNVLVEGALRRSLEHRRLMLAAARDELYAIESRAEDLLRQFGDGEPYLNCTLLAQLMAARRELYHFNDMIRLEAETRRALGRPGSEFASIALKASVAPAIAAQGKVEAAKTMLLEAVEYARTIRENDVGLAAIPALPLAELHYETGHLEEARKLVDEHLPAAREWSLADQIASGHLVRARLLFARGDLANARKVLEELQLVAIEHGLTRLRAYAISEDVRMLVCSGEVSHARHVLETSGLLGDEEPYPSSNPTRQQEAIAICVIRIDMHEHRLIQARKIARRWSNFARRNGAVRSTVTFELLLAQIEALSGNRPAARRALREAVTLAAQPEWSQVFIDEGGAIHALLIEAYGDGPGFDSVTDRFGEKIVAAIQGQPTFKEEESLGLTDKLMSREVEILKLVSGGLRNREIGDRLGLTEGTVKWYMQQIYDKLGVRRRPQAVMRARQLGILT